MSTGAFLTSVPQKKSTKAPKNERKTDLSELEALVSGVTATSQSTLLLKKKKEMREVYDALAFMKQQYLERMQTCDENHSVFEKKQLDMKDQVVKFEKFIQENDAKRQRAEMRAKDERRKVEQKQDELKALARVLDDAERERKKMQENLGKLKRYKEYLDATVDQTDEGIEQIDDIINRLRTLEGANLDLMDQQKQSDVEMDRVRLELQAFLMETQNNILVQNSKVHNFQNELERLRAASKHGGDEEEARQDRVKDVNRETGQIIMAIRNLYGRCCISTRTKMPLFNDKFGSNFQQLDKCLTFICDRIVDLQEVREGFESNNSDALPPIPMASQSQRQAGGKDNRGKQQPSTNKGGGVFTEGSAFL